MFNYRCSVASIMKDWGVNQQLRVNFIGTDREEIKSLRYLRSVGLVTILCPGYLNMYFKVKPTENSKIPASAFWEASSDISLQFLWCTYLFWTNFLVNFLLSRLLFSGLKLWRNLSVADVSPNFKACWNEKNNFEISLSISKIVCSFSIRDNGEYVNIKKLQHWKTSCMLSSLFTISIVVNLNCYIHCFSNLRL